MREEREIFWKKNRMSKVWRLEEAQQVQETSGVKWKSVMN